MPPRRRSRKRRQVILGIVALALVVLGAAAWRERHEIKAWLRPEAPTPDLDAEIGKASRRNQSLCVLVFEQGASDEDRQAEELVEIVQKFTDVSLVPLDFRASRNRATAARYHVTATPVLLGLTPRGLIVSRDEGHLTRDGIVDRLGHLPDEAKKLEAKFVPLLKAAAQNRNDSGAQLAVTDFLLQQQNDREAIPILAAVAHADTADPESRLRAWVDLCRAHLWVGEPEKCRHEAAELAAVLGTAHPEARAGASLVLATQDANAKRFSKAQKELQEAVAAAPDSTYGKQATEALGKLPAVIK